MMKAVRTRLTADVKSQLWQRVEEVEKPEQRDGMSLLRKLVDMKLYRNIGDGLMALTQVKVGQAINTGVSAWERIK